MARKRRKKKKRPDDTVDETAEVTVEESSESTSEDAEAPGDQTVEETTSDEDIPEDQVDDDETAEPEEADAENEEADDDSSDALQKELDDMKDKYIRARAEMDNFRKRKVKELDEARRNAKLAAIEEIMPVMDQFQMAVSAIDSAADLETIKMGMKMIQSTFDRAFENLGVETVSCVGEEFDPNLHEAVSVEPSEDVPVDHIIREWKAGYKLGDFLIRPATVVVSSGDADEDVDEDVNEEIEVDAAEDAE